MDDEATLAWEALVPHVVHPAKVAVLEALRWIGRPLSSHDLVEVFDTEGLYLSMISYHVRKLFEFGVIVPVQTRRVRGAMETFYYFPESR
jgi:hypothetical protein